MIRRDLGKKREGPVVRRCRAVSRCRGQTITSDRDFRQLVLQITARPPKTAAVEIMSRLTHSTGTKSTPASTDPDRDTRSRRPGLPGRGTASIWAGSGLSSVGRRRYRVVRRSSFRMRMGARAALGEPESARGTVRRADAALVQDARQGQPGASPGETTRPGGPGAGGWVGPMCPRRRRSTWTASR